MSGITSVVDVGKSVLLLVRAGSSAGSALRSMEGRKASYTFQIIFHVSPRILFSLFKGNSPERKFLQTPPPPPKERRAGKE